MTLPDTRDFSGRGWSLLFYPVPRGTRALIFRPMERRSVLEVPLRLLRTVSRAWFLLRCLNSDARFRISQRAEQGARKALGVIGGAESINRTFPRSATGAQRNSLGPWPQETGPHHRSKLCKSAGKLSSRDTFHRSQPCVFPGGISAPPGRSSSCDGSPAFRCIV